MAWTLFDPTIAHLRAHEPEIEPKHGLIPTSAGASTYYSEMKLGTSATYDYLNYVSDFISFLSSNELSLEEILSHLVQVVLHPLNAEAILIRQINSKNQSVLVATWGIPSEMLQFPGNDFDLRDKFPTTDTLRYRRMTWISTLPDWGDEYPLLKSYPYSTGAKSYVCFPIDRAGTPVAALGVFSRDVIHPNAEIESFLTAVGSVFSMFMFSQDSKAQEFLRIRGKHTPSDVGSTADELTERQQVVLRLISENRTNLAISELLGYSESTIRQETIKIFAKLGCSGRHEAALMYKAQVTKSIEK